MKYFSHLSFILITKTAGILLNKKHKIKTILTHDYSHYQDNKGAIVPPIFQNSLFAFENWDAIDQAFSDPSNSLIYSRLLNPTALIAEEKIAAIAHGEKAKLTASGMGAISAAIMHCVSAGSHIVTINTLYGPANNFINKYLKEKCGVSVTYIPGTDIVQFEEAIQENTSLIYLESPASLTYEIQNLKAVASLAKAKGIKTIIDNTWASPLFQQPLDYGIDISVHSVSKYICGHSDVVAGVIISSKEILDEIIKTEHALLGAKIAPIEAWLILRSLRTLPIRMKAHHEAVLEMIPWLESQPQIKNVLHPAVSSFPQYQLAASQMSGYGSLLSIVLNTEEIPKIKAFVDTLELFKLGVSWGGHESLVYAPVISYVKELDESQFKAMGIIPSLIRLSIGLEDTDDLKNDLQNALSKIL